MEIPRPAGKIALVPFVQARDQGSHEKGNSCPLHRPSAAREWESIPPGTEQKPAEREVADEVAGLTNEEVPHGEVGAVHSEQEVQGHVQNARGIFGRGEVRGFTYDEAKP